MAAHLWIVAVLRAGGPHLLGQSLLAAAVSGQEEEAVAQQAVVGAGQQLSVRERVWVATPVVHEGIPVAVGEGKNPLKLPKGSKSNDR